MSINLKTSPLKQTILKITMIGIEFLWGGPVYLETSIPVGEERRTGTPVHFLDPSAGGAGTTATPAKRGKIKWQRVCYIMDKRKLNRREVAMTMDTNTSAVDSDAAESVSQALDFLNRNIQDHQRHKPISFQEFLQLLNANPSRILRNIFQAFHDMIKLHVTEIENDIDSSAITKYDTGTLFMEGSDTPYFPDMLLPTGL